MATLRNERPVRTVYRREKVGKDIVEYDTILSMEVGTLTRPYSLSRIAPTDRWLGTTARNVVYTKNKKGANYIITPTLRQSQWFDVHAVDYANYVPQSSALKTKMLLKIKDQTSNLSVTLPELGKTTDMVFNLGRDVVKTFHSLRSGRLVTDFIRDLKSPRDRASKKASNRWLEYQMGWLPTVSDIYGMSEGLFREYKNGWIYAKVSEKSERRLSLPKTPDFIYRDIIATRESMIRARYRINSPGLKALSESGITNPALAAWELVPYSFVLDYLTGFGDWLSTFDALAGVKDLSYYTGTKVEVEISAGGPSSYAYTSPAYGFYGEKTRSKIEFDLIADTPGLSVDKSLKKLVNLTALLRNLR